MNFEVIKQTIRRTDSAPVIADSINYLTAKFRFSSDWADLEKHVTFTLGANVYDKTLDADDEIKADQGLNLTEGIWTIGIVGVEVVDGEMVERITADTVTVLVTMAGALGGEAFPEISGAFGEIILQSEADRVAAEAARVAAEEEREAFYAAAQTGFDEEARVTAENLRVEAENARAIAEATRENWYQDAQTGFDEAARVAAENLRIEAENARDIAEGLRDSAEQSRDSAEGLRVTAEQGRDTAEGLRVTAESGRDSAEGLRVTAEQGRNAAEGLRDTAEQARDSAEDSRIAAESARAFYAAYSGTTSYVLGNKVSYNGSSYIWTDDDPSVAGTQPPNTGWLLIASRGDDGTSGVYVGSDPIPEGYNVQIDPDGDATDVVLQFGTMPTPDADYLGVTALYTGTTGTYKNGGTYICVSSGGATPIYSWSRVGEDVSGAISTHNTDAGAHAGLFGIIDSLGDTADSLHRGVGVNNQIFSPRAAIFLRFDDAHVADETVFASLIARHLVAGFAVVENFIGATNYLSLERLIEFQANGMEIMHHSKTHPTVTNLAQANALGLSGFIEETASSADRLRAYGLNIQSFVLPGTISGSDNPMYFNTESKLKNEYANVLMRAYRNAQAYVMVNGSATETMPASRLWGHACGGTIESTTLAALQASVDAVIKYGGVFGFNSHSFNLGTAGKLSWADFNLFLDYLVTKRSAGLLDIITPSGAAYCRRGTKLSQAYDASFETISTVNPAWWILSGGATIETTGGHTGNNFAHIPYAGGTGNIGTNIVVKEYRTIEIKFWAKAPSTTSKFALTVADTISPKQYQLSTWGGITKMDFAPVSGGLGYTVGDLLTITGGSAVAKVISVDGSGAVTGLVLLLSGLFYSTGTKATTGGTGSGCTVNVTEVVGASFQGQTLTLGNTWTQFHFTFGIHDLTVASITLAAMSTGDGAIDIDDFEIYLI